MLTEMSHVWVIVSEMSHFACQLTEMLYFGREWPEGVLLEGVQHFEKNKIQGVTAC